MRALIKRRHLKPGTLQLHYLKTNVALNSFIFTNLLTLVQNIFVISVYNFFAILLLNGSNKKGEIRIAEIFEICSPIW